MVDRWIRGLWLYFNDDVNYLVDILVSLYVIVYRCTPNSWLKH
jgi:hypothetical protein